MLHIWRHFIFHSVPLTEVDKIWFFLEWRLTREASVLLALSGSYISKAALWPEGCCCRRSRTSAHRTHGSKPTVSHAGLNHCYTISSSHIRHQDVYMFSRFCCGYLLLSWCSTGQWLFFFYFFYVSCSFTKKKISLPTSLSLPLPLFLPPREINKSDFRYLVCFVLGSINSALVLFICLRKLAKPTNWQILCVNSVAKYGT